MGAIPMRSRSLFQFLAIGLAAVIAFPVSADSGLLAFIRSAEVSSTPASYNTTFHGFPKKPPKPLTEMTLGEVLAFQKSAPKTKSTAMGAYQILHATLDDLMKRHGLGDSLIFSPATQDRLARLLISDCSAARKDGTTRFGNCLTGIWAALPLLSGPNKGHSKYRGIAGNKARVTTDQFLAALNGQSWKLAENTTAHSSSSSENNVAPLRLTLKSRLRTQSIINETTGGLGGSIHKLGFDPYQID
jgi:hypothetical protein